MQNWSEKIRQTFGIETFPLGIFYEFEFALRFELGGEQFGVNQPIRRFLKAHERASSIANTAFADPTDVVAFIESWGSSEGPESDFSRLKLVLPEVRRNNFEEHRRYEENEEYPEFWHVAPISDAWQTRELLWLDIAAEMAIQPASDNHNTWLVDFEQKIILNAYDDRGLDIISTEKATLQPIYDKFGDWLLGYDREKMDAVFKAP